MNVDIETSIRINKDIDSYILDWVNKEAPNKKELSGVLQEIMLFNIKLIYSDTPESNAFLEYLNGSVATDFTLSRISNLYIKLHSIFPKEILDARDHIFRSTLKKLGYPAKIGYKGNDYGWLLADIQYQLYYYRHVN